MITHGTLHHTILAHIINQGYAPEVPALCQLLNSNEKEIKAALFGLEDYHGVVLHPNEPKIWVIHPFSLAPTNFLVTSTRGQWWGNCAWCSLGVAALLEEDVTITTSLGAHREQIEIHIHDGQILEKDLLVHFPIPMKEAWNNVLYTCSTMLVFRNEKQVEEWSRKHNIPMGDVQPISKIWAFSQKWYGQHLDPDWKKWTVQEAKEIFAEFGLTHEVWHLESSANRF